jgi:DNA-directed RNA polymerase subunit omega
MSSNPSTHLPENDILNNFEYGKFVLSNLAAKRAKQLKEGAPPLVRTESNHPITIALAEIAAGKIRPILGQAPPDSALVDQDAIPITEGTVPSELGILLPALDESEAGLGLDSILGHADHDDEEHHDDEAPMLSDILEDAEPVVVEAEADTVSLSEIADEEAADPDEETLN